MVFRASTDFEYGLMQSYAASTPVTSPFQPQVEASVATPAPPAKLHALDIQHNEYVASLKAAGHSVRQDVSTIGRTKIRTYHELSSDWSGSTPANADTEDECIKRAVSNRDVSRMIVGQEQEDVKVVMVFTTAPARPRLSNSQVEEVSFGPDVAANDGSNVLPILAVKRRASLAETTLVEGETGENRYTAHAVKRRRDTYGGSGVIDLCGNDAA
ncbi:hypothetical protein LTR78_001745 [Recurvomyces mirabilis]|uniref:Uncharacterized protein n=1 Tax=Recurvomyces mirabilis TaxID=574656 RepID=A0AAE0WV76_9PEZI|nr:hypothetical protein LTR78_001745 [Recurvomyces mirabilis]KAK5150180.1 hypothetical protein LTS14_010309 [Recurvomyces mirabilis]